MTKAVKAFTMGGDDASFEEMGAQGSMRRIVPWSAGTAVAAGALGAKAAAASCPLWFVTAGVGLLLA